VCVVAHGRLCPHAIVFAVETESSSAGLWIDRLYVLVGLNLVPRLFLRFRREMIEHLLHALVKVFYVLVGLV
jgi:hypothetical protein